MSTSGDGLQSANQALDAIKATVFYSVSIFPLVLAGRDLILFIFIAGDPVPSSRVNPDPPKTTKIISVSLPISCPELRVVT